MGNIIDFNKKRQEHLNKNNSKTKSPYDNIDTGRAIQFLENLSEKQMEKEKELKRQKTINAMIEILKTPIVFD